MDRQPDEIRVTYLKRDTPVITVEQEQGEAEPIRMVIPVDQAKGVGLSILRGTGADVCKLVGAVTHLLTTLYRSDTQLSADAHYDANLVRHFLKKINVVVEECDCGADLTRLTWGDLK